MVYCLGKDWLRSFLGNDGRSFAPRSYVSTTRIHIGGNVGNGFFADDVYRLFGAVRKGYESADCVAQWTKSAGERFI